MSKEYALILGVSSGIGAACATQLAKAGVNIIGLYMRKPKDQIEQLNNSINESNLITPSFVDNLPEETKQGLKKINDKDVTNLNNKINKIFDKL